MNLVISKPQNSTESEGTLIPTLIHQRVRAARKDENPTVICRVSSGWVVLGDQQHLRGYCLLLPDPVVYDLNALSTPERLRYLSDMATVGDALLEVTDAYRINYSVLGNTDPALHAHIRPRYMSEPEEKRKMPVYVGYSAEERNSHPFDLERDEPLMDELATSIQRLSSERFKTHETR